METGPNRFCHILPNFFSPRLRHIALVYTSSVDGNTMAPTRGSAAYKKKDGTLVLSRDTLSVSWTPTAPPGAKPAVTLAVSSITSE